MVPPVNKNRAGLGFSVKNDKGKDMKPKSALGKYQDIFRSGGYLHPTVSGINAIVEDEAEQGIPNYGMHGVRFQNWIHISLLFPLAFIFQSNLFFVCLFKIFHSAQGECIIYCMGLSVCFDF